MFYNFMELPDETIISHSDSIIKDGKESVQVYIEKPIDGGFATATCWLPDYNWVDVSGFKKKEMEHLKDIVESAAHIIIRYARNGGFENAANF